MIAETVDIATLRGGEVVQIAGEKGRLGRAVYVGRIAFDSTLGEWEIRLASRFISRPIGTRVKILYTPYETAAIA
jgi:hypothetical protein